MATEQSTGPVVNGEQFARGYTPEAAAYEQATRRTHATPGPWYVEEGRAVIPGYSQHIGRKPDGVIPPWPVAMAVTPGDAHLMAAAPDLYAAASQVLNRLDAWADSARMWARQAPDADAVMLRNQVINYDTLACLLRDAIRKAEGR